MKSKTKKYLSKRQTKRIHSRSQKHQARFEQAKEHAQDTPVQKGLVVSHLGNRVQVQAEGHGDLIRCHARGNLIDTSGGVVTGDHVLWQMLGDKQEKEGIILRVTERENLLERIDNFGKKKLIASNIDRIIITVAVLPTINRLLIDRYLVLANKLNLDAIIVCNKTDLQGREHADAFLRFHDIYTSLGYPIFKTSNKTGQGIDKLSGFISRGTSIFVGQSGVGKSSLLKTMLKDNSIKVGELGKNIAQGRHTTTRSQMFFFPNGGKCIDSPGIRELGLTHISADDVKAGFLEIQEYASQCRFRDCRHENEPGCAVRSAIDTNHIAQERLDSYQGILKDCLNKP